MEPNHISGPSSPELPAPVEQGEINAEKAPEPEVTANQPMVSPVLTNPLPLPPAPLAPLPLPPDPTATSQTTSAAHTSDLIADDSDLIEKEWVLKAKAIVAQTKNDPHAQNQSMSRVKADYLKKRYNKDLKLNEG